MVIFKTNDPYCKVKTLTSYSTLAGTLTSTTSLVKLKTNPTTRATNDFYEPKLNFKIDSTLSILPVIYLTGETEGIAGQQLGIIDKYKVVSTFCPLTPTKTTSETQAIKLMVGSQDLTINMPSLYTMPSYPSKCQGIDY